MAVDEFNENINIVVQFTQKGLAELTAQAKASLDSIASAGVAGGVGPGGLNDVQAQLRSQAAAYVSAARGQIQTLPQGDQAAARIAVNDLAKTLRTSVDGLVAQIRAAFAAPENITGRLRSEFDQRGVAAQEAVLRNSQLLGVQAPQVFQSKDILHGTGQFVSPTEATQQREAFAEMQQALIDAAHTLRQIAAIEAQGREAYITTVAEATVEEKTLSAQIRAEVQTRLAVNDEYTAAVATATVAQRDVASRIREKVNALLLGNEVPISTTGVEASAKTAAEGQTKLGEAATVAAEKIDVQALAQREASNKVNEAMLKAAATLNEIAAIGVEGTASRATYVAAQAEAAFGEKLLAQEITTETAEREAASVEYLNLTKRASEAQAKLAGAINTQATELIATGAAGSRGIAQNATLFQKLQAAIANRNPNTPNRDASSFSTIGTFIGQKALTTASYGASAAVFYSTFNGIRSAVEEANKFQVAMVNLEANFKATDTAGEFPKTRAAIIDLSNKTGIAGSDIAQIATTFKGAFGDTTRAVDETRQAVTLAIATGLSIGDVTNTVLAVDTAFHTTSQSIGDVTLSLQELTGVAAHETIVALGAIAPVADQVGLSLKQTASLLALSEQLSGRSATTIAENLQRILPSIQKNGVAILDLIATVPGLGKEFQQLGQDLNQGTEGKFFTDLIPVFSKLGPVAQNTAIELLGNRREAGALITVLQNGTKYTDLLSKATENNGKTQARAAAQLATLSKELSVLKTNLQNLVGDLLRSGLASGFSEALKIVEFLVGGVQQIESVFKDIDQVTGGFLGKLTAAAAIYGLFKGGKALFGGVGNIATGAPLVTGATQASTILVAGAERAAAALVAGGAEAGAENAAGGLGGGLLRGAGGAAAGGAVTDIFAGSTAAIPILPSVPILPVALTALVGFAAYKSAVTDAKKANAAAAAEADKFVRSFLAQRNDLDNAVSQFATGNRNLDIPSGITTKQLPEFARTQDLVRQSKNLQDLTDRLIKQAQEEYVKKFKDSVSDPTPLGPTGPVLYGQSPTLNRLATHLPIIGHLFDRGAKQKTPDEFTHAFEKVGKDVREQLTKEVFGPFLDQYIKDIADGTAKAIVTSGVNKGLVVGRPKTLPTGTLDPHGYGKADALKQADIATKELEHVKKLLGDGTSESGYKFALAYIDKLARNPQTASGVKRAFDQLRSKVEQARQLARSNNVETDLATQKQLVDAGAESMNLYLHNLEKQVDVLKQLENNGPLIPPLRLQLAQDLKEESDRISALADQAQSDADFLAGLTQNGAQLAQTKLADALTKLRSLPSNAPQRVQAAQDAINAAKEAFSQQQLTLDPGEAYRRALAGVPLPADAVKVLVDDEKKNRAAAQHLFEQRKAFYQSEIDRLKATETGGNTDLNEAGIKRAQQGLADANTNLDAIRRAPPILSPAKQASLDLADAARARTKALETIRAGDDPVRQAMAVLNDAAKAIQDDITFYGKVLPDDAEAFRKAFGDVIFAKLAAAEAEKEQAIQLKIDATRNPEAKAALLKALADAKAAYAASIASIPGHTQAAKDAANAAAQQQVTATNTAIDAQNAINRARLDLLAASTQDPVELARIAILQADEEARQAAAAQDKAAQLQAAAHRLQAQHQLADAISAEADAFDQYLIALANFHGDIIKASEISLKEAIRHFFEDAAAGKGKGKLNQDRASVVDALAAQRDSVLQSKEATIDFNLQLKKISTAQAIALYTALLSNKNTVQEQRDLLLKIQQLKQTLNQNLQFNLPTDLTLPTLYEARRFLQGGGANAYAQNTGPSAAASTQYADNRQIKIEVSGAGDPATVAEKIVQALSVPARYGTRPRTY